MNKELWLEFGYIKFDDNYEDMLWYNDGRWQELWYFIKHLFLYRNKKQMYFKWRYGNKDHYLRRDLSIKENK